MNVDRKKVVKNHYGGRLVFTVACILPIFGLIVILSTLDILPRLPLTEDMELSTASIILAGCFLGALILLFILYRIISGINEIIATGAKATAVITKTFKSRRQYTIFYSFEVEGETFVGRTVLARKINIRDSYEKGNSLEIMASKNAAGKMKSVPLIYV